jgi:hypothetical protein
MCWRGIETHPTAAVVASLAAGAALEELGMLSDKLGYLLGPGVEVDDARFAGEVLNGPDSLTGGDIP